MKTVICTTSKCEEARIYRCRKEMAGTVKLNKFAYWGNDDVYFELVLDKFGVDLNELNFPVDPKQKIRYWIKD